MKNYTIILFSLLLSISFISCNKKKYKEVVEVPLPSGVEKVALGSPDDINADKGAFEMVKLPYAYDALSPSIDALTMEMHYSKHYLTYTNNFNKAIAGTDLENLPIEELFKKLDLTNTDLRNNLGGYYNHTLFWEIIGPKSVGEPKDTLAGAINKDFETFDNFKSKFIDETTKQFGSGWTWLIVDKSGKLQITSTQNQDNPLMPKAIIAGTPILGIDLWEHAYYLGYQYKRKIYIENFFNIINWKKVSEKYEDAIRKKTI